jgi:ectoine hydroxylase-related dioxygenase (phytanoyl-CoA dioxygenase family)
MRSKTAQVFHDHVLVKEPGTAKATPWHQDSPYYFVDGDQNVSFWVPVDAVEEASLRCVVGSHRWPKLVLPVRWLSDENFYADSGAYIPVPDPDAEPDKYRVAEWRMQPGDAVAFHYRTLHGARGNFTDVGGAPAAVSSATMRAYGAAPGPHLAGLPGHRDAAASACAKTGSRSWNGARRRAGGNGAAAE